MDQVQIKYIIVNYIKYKLNEVFVNYADGEGKLQSSDIVINDFIRGRHKVYVADKNGKKVRLDYKYNNGQIYIANPANELA